MTMTLNDVDPGRRAAVVLDSLTRAEIEHRRQQRRPAALTAREALEAVRFESLLVAVAAGNLANGADLSDDDLDRLLLAANRIERIAGEVNR